MQAPAAPAIIPVPDPQVYGTQYLEFSTARTGALAPMKER
jgi:hypothetical protein